MIGSMDSIDFCTELPVAEKNAIPLDCWQDVCLPNIWIPSHLLPNRSKSCNTQVTQGIYHKLERKDPSKYNKSFSVYLYPDVEIEQGEIFLSDSDEDIFGLESTSREKIETLSNNTSSNAYSNGRGNYIETNNLNDNSESSEDENINPKENFNVNVRTSSYLEAIHNDDDKKVVTVLSSEENLPNSRNNQDKNGNVSVTNLSKSEFNITETEKNFASLIGFDEIETKDFKDIQTLNKKENKDTESLISLNEILDVTTEFNIKDFVLNVKKNDNLNFLSVQDKQELNSKKNKKDKVKKPSKSITLDEFLEDSVAMSQDYYCDKYFQSISREKNKIAPFGRIPIASKEEFPNLAPEECKFIFSDTTVKEKDGELSFKNFRSDFSKSDEITKKENLTDAGEIKLSMTDTKENGKIIIENIPLGVSKDDISLILCGYGEIKNFSLISAGNFLKANVEIDSVCDMDWIIECLNESEPFGAASEKLKCYKQQ